MQESKSSSVMSAHSTGVTAFTVNLCNTAFCAISAASAAAAWSCGGGRLPPAHHYGIWEWRDSERVHSHAADEALNVSLNVSVSRLDLRLGSSFEAAH